MALRHFVRKFSPGFDFGVSRRMSTEGHVLVMSNLYPQPNASAAGSRTAYILRQLCGAEWKSVHFAANSKESDDAIVKELTDEGVHFHSIEPNNSNEMKQLLDRIGSNLSMVIYDKFYTEEAFSFHIHNERPDAVQVVDMQDMHSLRRGRQRFCEKAADGWDCIPDSLSYSPAHTEDLLLRELASLHRSDLSLVCSPAEHDLLVQTYQIPSSKLCTASFWVDASCNPQPWLERHHFFFVGGFRHDPNVDAVKQLANHVWPAIRERLPDAELHVYGAHINHQVSKLHDPKQGLHIMGFCADLDTTLSRYRVLLAPLRFGAGIKGKIIDGWRCGVPVVTTSIGSEGMLDEKEWGGSVANLIPEFCDAAVNLHCDQDSWNSAVQRGKAILEELYSTTNWSEVAMALQNAVQNREDRRSKDLTRSLLWQQGIRSTEYFSRWIEAKNQKL